MAEIKMGYKGKIIRHCGGIVGQTKSARGSGIFFGQLLLYYWKKFDCLGLILGLVYKVV